MSDQPAPPNLSGRRVVAQVAGFIGGIALLAWCIHGASKGDGWSQIADAPRSAVVGMIICSIISGVANGTSFWISIRPVKPIGWGRLQLLNVVGVMLNYAPVRLGAMARIWYHWRVDRLTLIQIGGWFAFILGIFVMGVGAAVVATAVRPQLDWIWGLMLVAQMAIGGLAIRGCSALPLLQRHAQGIDRIAASHQALWGACVLRLIDIAAFAGRIWFAARVVGLEIDTAGAVMLGVVALGGNLAPVGRVGVREFLVALAAGWMQLQAEEASELPAQLKQMALIDSAAEAIIVIPLGIIALIWYRAALKGAGPAPEDAPQ